MARAEEQLLTVDLRLRDQLTGPLGAAKAQLAGLDAQVAKTGTSLGGLSGSLGGIAKAGIGAFAAFKAFDVAGDFLAGSISKASALNETMSKSAVIFKQDAAAVEEWGKTAATAFGLSAQQAIEARATIGNLFTTMGLGREDVLGMSGAVVALAADLASFNNIGTDEALIKLRAGLVGEVEPLRTLGVALNETVVRQKAVALGLVQGNAVLSESAKVQARYALILEQTKTAQGDFARTSDGLANSQRKLDAALADLQARLGELAVPVATTAVQGLERIVAVDLPNFAENSAREIDTLADALTPAARAADVVSDRFQDLAKGARDAIGAARDLAGITGDLPPTLADVAAQAKAAGDGIAAWTLREREGTQATITLGAATVALTADTEANAQALLEAREKALAADKALAVAQALLSDSSAELNNDLLTAADGLTDYTAAARGATVATDQLTAAQRTLKANVAAAPFINPRAQPGTGDSLIGAAFSSGGDQGALDQRSGAFDREAARERERQAERERLAEEARRKREQAADEALRKAKQRAAEEARAYEKALGKAFDAAKDRANSLFDTLHNRHVQAIKDAETLAEKQHAGALRTIADALKFAQIANNTTANAAADALNTRQQAQSRRGLVESLNEAQAAFANNRSAPGQSAADFQKQTDDLARSLRNATEALENFDDAAKVARLVTVAKTQDDKDAATAAKLTEAADKALAEAKAKADRDLAAETIAAAKRKTQFESQLEALKERDLKLGKTPAQQKADIDKLGERFGITTDKFGFHHVQDPLVTAIKELQLTPPVFNNYFSPSYVINLDGKKVAAALASSQSPTSTPFVRTGAAGRS